MSALSRIELLCQKKGLKMTGQRRVIARVLSEAEDHPDVDAVYRRATRVDSRISKATVYRTVRLFEETGILERHDFVEGRGAADSGDAIRRQRGRARYEELPGEHHDHLIDTETGRVIEFSNIEIEKLQEEVARKLGYRLVDHRLELYGVPLDSRSAKDGGDADE